MQQNKLSVQPVSPIARSSALASDCYSCLRRSSCVAGELDASQLLEYNRRVKKARTFERGEPVFSAGDPFRGMHIVKSGFFESHSVTKQGEMRVHAFHIAGDIFGLESVGNGGHTCTTSALTHGTVCTVPLSLLRENSELGLVLLHKMLELMAQIILRDRDLIYSLATMNASQRVATFLLDLVARMEQAGFRKGELELHMHRVDIGSYLGLAEETVSRVFTRFRDEGILCVNRRRITCYDLDRLRAVIHDDN